MDDAQTIRLSIESDRTIRYWIGVVIKPCNVVIFEIIKELLEVSMSVTRTAGTASEENDFIPDF